MAYRQKEKGFLLIEVVIAMVIISIALVAATGMFIQATRANSEAEQYTTATALAQEQLERLKQKPYTFWASLNAGATIDWQGTGAVANTITLNKIDYNVATVTETSDDPTHLVQVKVTVSWSGTKSVVMTAVYPKIALPK